MFNSHRAVLDKLYWALGDTEPGFVSSFMMFWTSIDYDGFLLCALFAAQQCSVLW